MCARPSNSATIKMTAIVPVDLLRRIRTPGYVILGVSTLLPLFDFAMSVMPVRMDSVAWRFGAFGLIAGAIAAPLLILLFLYVLALLLGDRKVVKTVGIVCAILTVFFIVAAGAFALDTLQMKARVQATAMNRFYLASAQAMLKLAISGFCSGVLAISAFRRSSELTSAASRGERARSSAMNLRPSGSQKTIERPGE